MLLYFPSAPTKFVHKNWRLLQKCAAVFWCKLVEEAKQMHLIGLAGDAERVTSISMSSRGGSWFQPKTS